MGRNFREKILALAQVRIRFNSMQAQTHPHLPNAARFHTSWPEILLSARRDGVFIATEGVM